MQQPARKRNDVCSALPQRRDVQGEYIEPIVKIFAKSPILYFAFQIPVRRGQHALDVRVLATSNRDLEREVKDGRFREDLYYRLNVFPLHIPPLRERAADIVPLASWLLHRGAQSTPDKVYSLSPGAAASLT